MIFGDFNINWSDKTNRKKLKAVMSKFDFNQMVKGATRITRTTQSSIDLIFTNREERVIKTYNLITGLSDRNMILAARKLTKKRFPNYDTSSLSKKSETVIPKQDLSILKGELERVTWENVVNSNDPNTCCNELMTTVGKIVGKFFKTCKYSNRKRSLPWVNALIRKLMKRRDFALKTFLKSRSSTDMVLYKGLRNRVIKELRNAKATYYISVIREAKGNNNLIWKQINSLIKPEGVTRSMIQALKVGDQLIMDSGRIANEFNNFCYKVS